VHVAFLVGWNKTETKKIGQLLPSSHILPLSASFHQNQTEKLTLKVTEDQ